LDYTEFQGRKYYQCRDGRWADYSNNKIVEADLQDELNKNDLIQESPESLYKEAKRLKENKNYELAIKKYERLLSFETFVTGIMISELSSCYRKVNRPHKSIELYECYLKKNNSKYISDALHVSAAGAYRDLNFYDEAYACLDRVKFKSLEYNNIKKWLDIDTGKRDK